MNLNILIAERIGKKAAGKGKLSRISNLIASISVALSIAVMIIAIAVAGGFRNEIREKASGFTGDITLQAPGVDITNHLYPIAPLSYMEKLDSLPFIESISPVNYRTGLLKSDDHIQGVMFKGIDGNYNLDFFKSSMVEGRLPDYTIKRDSTGYIMPPSNEILISKRLSDMLGFKPGDKIISYFVDEDVTLRRFTVCGIFDARLDELDKTLVIADARHITHLNRWKNGELCGYEISLKKGYGNKAEECSAKIDETIMQYSKDEDSSIVSKTLSDRYFILFDWLHLLDLNVVIILALMIAVAGFNMVSGILIILFERISQIGLFKALGMRDSNITKVFLYRAASIVIYGLIPGNIIAILFCWIERRYRVIPLDPTNYFVDHVPAEINITTIIGINVIAFVAIMLILLIPCRMISRISPARTLKVE